MTIQTKRYIELSDIVSIRLTCKHCDASLSLSLLDPKLTQGKDARHNDFLGRCPSCGRYWADNNGTNYEPNLKTFTVALDSLRRVLHEQPASFGPGFHLALEINVPVTDRVE